MKLLIDFVWDQKKYLVVKEKHCTCRKLVGMKYEKTFVVGHPCIREKTIVENQTGQMIGTEVVEDMRKTLHADKDFVVKVGQTPMVHHTVIKKENIQLR